MEFVEKLKSAFKDANLFQSQDSKFYILTATKLTLVPVITFTLIIYSLRTVMEMNYNFFIANGFDSNADFKQVFYDRVLMNIYDFLPMFAATIIAVFFTGLVISWLVLKTYELIQDHIIDVMDEEEDEDFEAPGMLKTKLISQVSRIFLKYTKIYSETGKAPKMKLPEKFLKLKSPPIDKVFFVQYALIVCIISLATNILLFSFLNELYQQVLENGITLLESNKVIMKFLVAQEKELFNIYYLSIGINVALYIYVSKGIINSIDGVSYGFARDMISIMKGEHKVRMRPRFHDPGQTLAQVINEYLDHVFYEDNVVSLDDKTSETQLPPAFVEQKMTANGEHVFHITTPDGEKVENIDKEMLLKLVKK
jgi:hypothetical protein